MRQELSPKRRSGCSVATILGAAACSIVATACSLLGTGGGGGDRKAQKLVHAHFDVLEHTSPFQANPPSSALVIKGRRDTCRDPGFDRKEPAVWRRYSFEGSTDTMLSFYTDLFTKDRWTELSYSAARNTLGKRFTKDLGGWQATVDLDVGIQIKTVDITGADTSVHVCPK